MEDRIEFVGEMQALALQPGDVLVMTAPGVIEDELARRIRHAFQAEFPGHKIVVLGDGMTLGVLRPEPASVSSIERKLDTALSSLAALFELLAGEDDAPEQTLDGEQAGRERDQNQGL